MVVTVLVLNLKDRGCYVNMQTSEVNDLRSKIFDSLYILSSSVRLVEEFRGHTEGANPSRKTSENAKQRAKHVRDFLEYMADSAIPNVDLLFLSNHARIRG